MKLFGKNGQEYDVVIGLEIHAQIQSERKLFSPSKTSWNDDANTNISNLDVGIPGSLQVLSMENIAPVIRAGIGINGTINEVSQFDRKNYFYPDLPTGYQITQFYKPIVTNGFIKILDENGEEKTIRIDRIHIEQDAGKSIHDLSSETYLDYNRAGTGLMEIVSHPDLSSGLEAAEYVKKIRSILRAVSASEANMDRGSMRVDVNVSIKKKDEKKLGNRCEIKNLNSIRFLQVAVEFEAKRHLEILESGGTVDQETRLFSPESGETKTMRKKEDSMEYKYFPDPDLPLLKISREYIEKIRENMPELPEQKFARYIANGVVEKEARIISDDLDLSCYFDEVCKKHDVKLVYTFVIVELLGRLNKTQIAIEDSAIKPSHIIELLDLIESGKINGKIAKSVMDFMFENLEKGIVKPPLEIVSEHGLEQMDNTNEIIEIIKKLLSENAEKVESYRNGNQKLFGFFVGLVMKESGGRANPASVNKILKDLLDGK